MLKILSVSLLLLALHSVIVAQEPPTSLIEKRVTFAIPDNWEIQKQEDAKTMGRTQILIPYPATDDTLHSANAAIIANTVPAEVTIKQIGDRVYGVKHPGFAIVNDIPDGNNWRTIVWTAKTEGVPYVMLDRFGLVNRIAVEFMVGFPLMENGDPKWVEKVVNDFNATCLSLKIDGTNSDKAKIYLDKLPSRAQQETIYEPNQVDEKAKITARSEPRYTEQARRNRTSGWVVLRVVLQASGKIGEIKVIRDAPDGLTEECIRVAREIKFVPAQKDGQPVSTYARVEYNFDVQ